MDNVAQTPFYPLEDILRAIRGAETIDGLDSANLGVMGEIARWTEDFLCQPNADLGRTGDVCPYTSVSMREGLLLVSVCHVFDAFPIDAIASVMRSTLEEFEQRKPQMGNKAGLKAMLVLFPSLESEFIEATQEDLSVEFAAKGLMLGEFHAESDVPGLRNPEFRPLRSPIPLLGIRTMMLTDLPFLMYTDKKLGFYLERFGDAALKAITTFLKSSHGQLGDDVYARLEGALKGEHPTPSSGPATS